MYNPKILPAGENSIQIIYIAVGVVCLVLGLLMVAVIYLIWAKQSKGKCLQAGGERDPLATQVSPGSREGL